MDMKKIGAFIAACRKEKGYTQQQLAEKLGVTNKTVSRWETGKYVPDFSLMRPLCEELGISLNELFSGERIEEEHLEEKSEENISNTIDYFIKKISNERSMISIGFMAAGLILCISAFLVFDRESSWGSVYSVIGLILFFVGFCRKLPWKKLWKRICVSVVSAVVIFCGFCVLDYFGVAVYDRPPIYRYKAETVFGAEKVICYSCLFYKAYRINPDTVNEYYIVDTENQYTLDTVPLSPFDREKSGMENLLSYQSEYIGDNSNDGALPLSEYGFVFEIDPEQYGLTVDYHATAWYGNDDLYVEKGLLYNSVSIFLLIDNVESIRWNFSGSSYIVTRDAVEAGFPDYDRIKPENSSTISEEAFNEYLEMKMNDPSFVAEQFQLLFSYRSIGTKRLTESRKCNTIVLQRR